MADEAGAPDTIFGAGLIGRHHRPHIDDRLGAKWGLQVVSDSRPGAAGNIAARAAARVAPDGYNYFLAVASTLAVDPYTFKSLPSMLSETSSPSSTSVPALS